MCNKEQKGKLETEKIFISESLERRMAILVLSKSDIFIITIFDIFASAFNKEQNTNLKF